MNLGEEEIRALSWKQPFASLMLHGKVETRTWPTQYRGLVLICASAQPYGWRVVESMCGTKQFLRIRLLLQTIGIDLSVTYGKAIAVGRLVDCWKMNPEDENKAFVGYQSHLYCHVYGDVKPIKPFAWKGAQKWKKVDQETIDKIEYLK